MIKTNFAPEITEDSAAAALLERERQRTLVLAELRSDANSPERRIQVWERLHGLRLPPEPNHPVLDIIAVATRLTLEQVRQAQADRVSKVD